MANQTAGDRALVAAVFEYLRTMHQEADAIIAALDAERARVNPGRRTALCAAGVANIPAKPAMRRIAIHPRVSE